MLAAMVSSLMKTISQITEKTIKLTKESVAVPIVVWC